MEREGLSGFELLVVVIVGIGLALVGAVWAGASLALAVAGDEPRLPFSAAADAAIRLPANLSTPAEAWAEPYAEALPGVFLYWCSTALAATAILGVSAFVIRWVNRSKVGTAKRRPLGVDGRTKYAKRRDLAPLLVSGPTSGRFVIARFGRHLVATESPPPRTQGRVGWLARRSRRSDRGAVALFGPSRSGKTTAAVAGVLEWDGPAVLSSVKADLLATTQGWRSTLGEVRVYDPTSSTTPKRASAMWSPLQQAGTVVGAQRAARALCDAAPRGGVEGGMDFWLAQAEILLSGLLFVAHNAHRDMDAVCEWVLTQDRPGELGPGEVRAALDSLNLSNSAAVGRGAVEVAKGLVSVWEMEERTRSSIYATAQTVIWPWTDPGVAASARAPKAKKGRRRSFVGLDLPWLLSGSNTVYLCSPIEDQRRLAPAFGGLLNDLINQAYRHVAATGKPLDPPLLVVIDEAGNTPLRSLPEYASTLAGLGVLLVTIWQSLAQLEVAYGKAADTILTNHLTKVFYAGLSDSASIQYVDRVLGEAEVDTRSHSAAERTNGGSDQFSTTRLPLAPAHVLRQMRPGDALLVHGTLPPAHVRTRPFYRSPHLANRAATDLTQEGTRA
ncbi:type IV secretory system conjugative DNA transfer family protein [Iamia majanohamensis]|uniref:Type IV secretory system conjugative DNA transfer family protein n=1 Tax=Iamia majanohamensis TaxID=467976 RepID=A0AAE9YBA5_9ACTN|nr:type IV secretory system conjugative DNA transfer family protein [Iamia majanohamensis]WCO67968.1 type IV secretory system conjugative DNA transfer family protein [Iamia majanohamensis]